jgi:hypothetical protein
VSRRPLSRKAIGAFVVGVLLLVHAGFALRAGSFPPGSVDRYWELATARGVPAVDYAVEYPILTLGVLRAEGAVSTDRQTFAWVVVVTNLALDVIIAALILGEWGFGATVVYLIGVALLGKLVFRTTDFLPTLLATSAVIWAGRGRAFRSGGALAVGGGFKLWPLALAPLLWPRGSREQARRYAIGFGVAAAAIAGVWLALSGWAGLDQVLTSRHAKGWQIESIPSNIVRMFNSDAARNEAGASRLGHASVLQHVALWIMLAAVVAWASWRGRERDKIAQAWVAIVASLLVFSALLSPQFVLWLLPAAAMAWTVGERTLATLVLAVALLTRIEFGGIFGIGGASGLSVGTTSAVVLLTMRNVMLVVVLLCSLYRLRPAEAEPALSRREVPGATL